MKEEINPKNHSNKSREGRGNESNVQQNHEASKKLEEIRGDDGKINKNGEQKEQIYQARMMRDLTRKKIYRWLGAQESVLAGKDAEKHLRKGRDRREKNGDGTKTNPKNKQGRSRKRWHK